MKTKLKSLALSLRGYVTAIFTDVRYLYGRTSDWERDHSRLLHELGIKGERLLTLDFPAIGKHFDMCLDQGAYSPCSLPLTRLCSKAVRVPSFLRGLYLRVFDRDGKLRVAPDPGAILALRTIFMGAKKLRLPYKERSLRNELQEFMRCEQAIRSPTLNWVGDDLFDPQWVSIHQLSDRSLQECVGKHSQDVSRYLHLADILETSTGQLELDLEDSTALRQVGISKGLVDTIQRVADIVSSSLGDLHSEDPSELPKHGPGVVSDVSTGESKYDFPYWTPKTEAIFPYDYYGHLSLGASELSCGAALEYISHEVSSRLIAVPKSAKGPRLIAAEPSAHQWLQQLVLSQLVRRLEQSPIAGAVRFTDQTRNRAFALRGSIDGSFATIDLSSASDRLSCWSVERFFRANPTLLERLHASRTRSASWRQRRPSEHPSFGCILKKFAPMGSACTFPVQSIIYCIISVGVRLWLSRAKVSTHAIEEASARISVFGDDIIVPRLDCPTVIQALEYMGLKVNTSKTFFTGKFRESCGIDAWGGDDVTPPYVLTLLNGFRVLADGTSSVEVSNNFFTKGFWNTSRYLQDLVGKGLNLIPITSRGDLSNTLFSYSGTKLDHLKRRYNVQLQRDEVRCLTTKSSKDRGPCSAVSRLFQWYIEKPRPDTHWVSGVVSRKSSITNSGWHPTEKYAGRSNYSTSLRRER